jgi:hypothetical protein
MWNSRKYTAMAVLGAGLAFAAATPASAQWLGGAYGYAGGCGAYAYASGCGGYGAYGYAPSTYAGVYSYGWPYGIIGDVGYTGYGYGAYGYAGGGCGGGYGYAPIYGYAGGGCGGYGAYGAAPVSGYVGGCGSYGAYGYAPMYGFAGSCRARRSHGYGGYATARVMARPHAYASYIPQSSHQRQLYAAASSPRYSSNDSTRRHLVAVKQAAYLDR